VTELAEIFRRYGPLYREKYGDNMLPSHRQAMRAIERCRTPALGGHAYHCAECDETRYQYHSCRNRHCPKCQNGKGQQWLERQKDLLLSAPYFLLTCTLPSALRPVARSHQKLIYHLLFRASADAIQKLAQDERFVGGQMGMVGVLHTWGRNLTYHPHVHYLLPAGGLDADGRWRTANKRFLFPVKALSRIFRAKFRTALRETDCYDQVPASVWKQEWVVHCQSVGDGLNAVKYLAPYIFRVAISNRRILKLDDGRVTFRYRNADTAKLRTCALSVEEFIRRFLQHVLPKGFVKVRYYGFLSPGLRPRLAALRLQRDDAATEQSPDSAADAEDDAALISHSAPLCPSCGRVMRRCSTIVRPSLPQAASRRLTNIRPLLREPP
jgi:hypothetical protein